MTEGYCTLMEISSSFPNPWQADPQLQRPAIVVALARCLIGMGGIIIQAEFDTSAEPAKSNESENHSFQRYEKDFEVPWARLEIV